MTEACAISVDKDKHIDFQSASTDTPSSCDKRKIILDDAVAGLKEGSFFVCLLSVSLFLSVRN